MILVPRHGIVPWLMFDLMSHLESAPEPRQAFWAQAVALGLAIWESGQDDVPGVRYRATAGRSDQAGGDSDRWNASLTRAQFLARLKVRTVCRGQGHRRARLGITPEARRALVQRETAEATDLDALPGGQRCAQLLKQRSDRRLDVGGRQMVLFKPSLARDT